MSKLSDLKNVNEHINQGTLYQEKRRQTLGSFSTLEDNETENTYGILEPFLAIAQQTDGSDAQAGSSDGYSDLPLNELYVIYQEKLSQLDETLNNLSDSNSLNTGFEVKYISADMWFNDGDGGNHKINRYSHDLTSSINHSSPPDFETDNSYSDAVLLTCGEMTLDVSNGGTVPTYSAGSNSDLSQNDSVCNPFDTGADNFKTAINLITQLNELVSVMKTKADEGDTSLMIDLDQTLSEAQNKYNSVMQNKLASHEPQDKTNYSDDSSGYLEIEGLKYDSAKLLYIMLLLGTLILGGITVSRIIKASK